METIWKYTHMHFLKGLAVSGSCCSFFSINNLFFGHTAIIHWLDTKEAATAKTLQVIIYHPTKLFLRNSNTNNFRALISDCENCF